MNKLIVNVPFTGLGLYGGFRGNRWLRNRIKIFEQFVVPSLQNQVDQDFILWVSWRKEEKTHPYVIGLKQRLDKKFKTVFTYTGCPFWDDKYEDDIARDRLFWTLKDALPELMDAVGSPDNVIWMLQPSDDCYHAMTFASVKAELEKPEIDVVSFKHGYLCNYNTKEVLEYNPKTNPPFFAVKYPTKTFFDPGAHMNFTGPFKSHEYIGEKLRVGYFDARGFLVGTHGENISTHFNHPYGGAKIEGAEKQELLHSFGLLDVPPLKLPFSIRKWIMRHLPHQWRRKLRYWFGEIIGNKIYHWIRN